MTEDEIEASGEALEALADGPVMAGQSYWVGERGPEVFTPNQSGQIGEAAGSSITVNVTLPSGGGANVSEAALSRAVASAVRRAERWA